MSIDGDDPRIASFNGIAMLPPGVDVEVVHPNGRRELERHGLCWPEFPHAVVQYGPRVTEIEYIDDTKPVFSRRGFEGVVRGRRQFLVRFDVAGHRLTLETRDDGETWITRSFEFSEEQPMKGGVDAAYVLREMHADHPTLPGCPPPGAPRASLDEVERLGRALEALARKQPL